jgi:hypothetical protein
MGVDERVHAIEQCAMSLISRAREINRASAKTRTYPPSAHWHD